MLAPFKRPTFVESMQGITPAEFSRAAGWSIATAALLAMATAWLRYRSFDPYVGPWLLLGVWLAMRHSSLFGVSDSTLELLREERPARKISAKAVHALVDRVFHRKSKEQLMRERLLKLGAVLATAAVAILLVRAVFVGVPNPAGQSLIMLLVVLAKLAYCLNAGKHRYAVLCLVAAYAVLALSLAPLFAILAMLAVSAAAGLYAWRRDDMRLFLLVVTATYLSLLRWSLYQLDVPVAEQLKEAMIAEIVLLCSFLVGLPLAYRRRRAAERETVRTIIAINAAALVGLTGLQAVALNAVSWPFCLAVISLLSLALTAIAWQQHGRASYAKHFFLAHASALLLIVSLTVSPPLVGIVWLVGSVLILTGGFLANSYSFRLAGLGLLAVSVTYYLFFALPYLDGAQRGIGSAQFVIGVLLAAFLIMAGGWFHELQARGPEHRLRRCVSWLLYGSAGSVIVSLIVVKTLGL